MADTSKLGTILIVAVICVGALLLVSAAIPAWQEYQRAAGPGGELPGLPSAGTVGKDPVSPSSGTVGKDPVSPSSGTVGKDPVSPSSGTVGKDPVSPSSGTVGKDPVSPSSGTVGKDPVSPSSGTVGKDPVSPSSGTVGKDPSSPSDPVSPSAGPAALSAPAADDPVLGTWTGTKSVTLFFVSANGDATATFRNDYTGDISGEFHGAGMNEVFASGFVWQNNGGGRYTGSIGSDSVEFILQGETLSMTINPKELGLNDLLDLDIPVEMHRV